MKWSSICLIDRQQQRSAAGLLLSAQRTWDIEGLLQGVMLRAPVLSSKCGQCHVDSRGMRLNTRLACWALLTYVHVRQVRLPDAVAQPVHAVELGGRYVVSHYDVDESSSAGARVCVVDAAGELLRDHADPLSQPHHLAAVTDPARPPLVAVADCGNDRVKLVDAGSLSAVAVVGGVRRPHRLCVDRGRLYVGQWDGRVLVFQLHISPGV